MAKQCTIEIPLLNLLSASNEVFVLFCLSKKEPKKRPEKTIFNTFFRLRPVVALVQRELYSGNTIGQDWLL
jgi:hypothetical protein